MPRRESRVIASLALFAAVLARPATACAETDAVSTVGPAEATPSAGVEVDVPSRSISRGVPLNDGPAVQPSMWIGLGGASATAWMSFDPALAAETGHRPTDFNGVLAYETSFGPVTVAPSATWITFPGLTGVPQTVELALDATLELGPVAVCTTNVVDAVAFEGAWFVRAGLCATLSLAGLGTLEADVGAAGGNRRFHEANAAVATTGLGHVETNLGWTLPVLAGTYVRLHGTYSRLVHPALIAARSEVQLAVGGLAVGAEL